MLIQIKVSTALKSAGREISTEHQTERDPPAQPTPVTFPERRPLSNDAWADPASPPKLQPLYSKIVKPSDISDEHLNVLNVQISSDCAPEDLIPISPDGTSLTHLRDRLRIRANLLTEFRKLILPAAHT